MPTPYTPLEQKQISAFLEMIPYPDVPIVREALDSGSYRGVSLIEAQKFLLSQEQFKELDTNDLSGAISYNRHNFEEFLNKIKTDPRGLYDRLKRSLWSNDKDILNPSKVSETANKSLKGELVPPRSVSQAPPPLPPVPDRPQQTKTPLSEKAKQPPPRTRPPEQEKGEDVEQQQEQQMELQPSEEIPTTPTNHPPAPTLNPLPRRSSQIAPRISKISRRTPPTPTRINRLPRMQFPQAVRSTGLNIASGSQVAARKGLSQGLGGLGSILGNIPQSLGNFLGSPGGNPSPGKGRGRGLRGGRGRGGRFFGSGRNGGLRNLAKKGIGRWLLAALLLLVLFAAVAGLFGESQTSEGCPQDSVVITKEVDSAPKESSYYKAENGQAILYTITAQGSCGQDFTIEDTLPATVELVTGSVTEGGTVQGKKISWKFPSLSSPKTLKYSVTPTQDNVWVINEAKLGFSVSGGLTSGGPGAGGGRIIDSQSRTLDQVFVAAAQNANLPPALLKAIAKSEAPKVFDYNEEEFTRFSQPGWWEGLEANAPSQGGSKPESGNHPDIIRGYAYNTCAYRNDCAPGSDVRGVTQFEIKTWNGIAGNLRFADSHAPDRRNSTDAIFGSAILNRQNAESYKRSSEIEWTEDVVRAVARMYCAGPAAGRNPARAKVSACGWNGSMGYDDFVWRDYQIYLAQP